MNKVLVTGGCGFLGSHICQLFREKGWNVVAYDNLTKFEYSRIPYFDLDAVRDYNLRILEHDLEIPVIIEDISNSKMLNKAAYKCNYIIHCAAQPAMTIAIEQPELDFEVNVKGTLNVLECAKFQGVPMVNCSTIHVYGNGLNNYLKEGRNRFSLQIYPGPDPNILDYNEGKQDIGEDAQTLTGTLSPLHASKRAAEIYVQTYIDTYRLRAANFRLTGMYGPRQFGGEDHGWVANFAIRTLLDLPITVFGTDKQVRDILYVEDAAEAFYKWFEEGCPSGTYNIGGGKDCRISIKDCLKLLKGITCRDQDITLLPARFGDLYYFCCDTYKAEEAFGWTPKVKPLEGLTKLVEWIDYSKEAFRK